MNLLNFGAVLSTHFFILGMFLFQVSYPVRLLPVWLLYLIALLELLLAVNYYLKLIELPLHIYFLQYIPFFMVAIIFTAWQWRVSKGHPLNRVALLLLQLSIMFPSLIAVVFYATPLLLGQAPLLSHDVIVLTTPFIIFIGWSIAVLRYRLFDIEYWWFKSWLWLLGGALVILLDIALVTLFYTPQIYALGLSVILAGFVYFPLRQWLLGKLMPLDSQSVQDFLPVFNRLMSDATSGAEFEQRWQTVMHKRFHPLHLDAQPNTLTKPALSENGLHLYVPALTATHSYRLTGKQMAARLFGRADIRTMESLLEIARIGSNASTNRKQAVLDERRRVMHDLHDTIGARLLTLAHSIHNPQQRQSTLDTLQLLRDMIHLGLEEQPGLLDEHLADLRAEVVGMTEAQGVSLHWQVDPALEARCVPVAILVETLLFIRETSQHLLASGCAEQLSVHLDSDGQQILIRIQMDAQRPQVRRIALQ
ncbi:MAG: hypothetical protein R3E95_24300 [Thiolinea sp.]